METSTFSSEMQSRRNKIGAIIFLVLGIIGFFDAGFLAFESFRGTVPACTILSGCNEVLLSKYAKIGPVPLSYLGVFYYSIVIFGALLYLDLKKRRILHALAGFTLVGIIASAYFLYLQFFVLKALCIYCLFSALSSTLLFINGLYIFIKTDSKHSWVDKAKHFFTTEELH